MYTIAMHLLQTGPESRWKLLEIEYPYLLCYLIGNDWLMAMACFQSVPYVEMNDVVGDNRNR